MEQIGFLVDLSKCIGCKACEIACKNRQHLVAPGPRPRRVRTTEEGTFPDTKVINLSLSCMHCADPACVANCPAGALSKDENDGSVKVDVNRCIGCKTCSQVCPFDVPQYREEEGTMAKCDPLACRRASTTPSKWAPWSHCGRKPPAALRESSTRAPKSRSSSSNSAQPSKSRSSK